MSAPFPFRLRIAVDGQPLDLASPHWRVHRRVLDLRRGILHGHGVYETEADRRTVVRTRRRASLNDLHLLLHESLAARARYADALHHEYPRQLAEFVSRALPRCSPEECRCIADIALCRGDVAAELLELIERKRISILVVGWHGRFTSGRARVLKRLIPSLTRPVLLVRSEAWMPFRLKVGEDID